MKRRASVIYVYSSIKGSVLASPQAWFSQHSLEPYSCGLKNVTFSLAAEESKDDSALAL